MRGLDLERAFLACRRDAKMELVFFVNAGDPCPDVTFDMLRVLDKHRVATVELCVPFPKSLTDGSLIKASHQRALSNGITLSRVLELVTRARSELGLKITLLADYSYTIKPLGLDRFLEACFRAGTHATLIHCLPQSLRHDYVHQSAKLGLGRIMSFFVGSEERVRRAAYQEAEGFVYVVSRFGRTGQTVSFDALLLDRLADIRAETQKPLAVGFGVKTAEDISTLRRTGADALIIGSAAAALVQNNIATPDRIAASFDDLVLRFAGAASAKTHPGTMKSVT